MVIPKDKKYRADQRVPAPPTSPRAYVRGPMGRGVVGWVGGSRPQPGSPTSNSPGIHPDTSALGSYLALPRHADGRAVLVAGGAVNDLLSLPYVEAIAHCLAVQLTLPIALHYKKQQQQQTDSFFFLYFLLR